MDKIQLNNQIVVMRKFVKQAKIHVLSKLTKDVKLYQNKKGTDSQVSKYKRKAERILEEIKILQKTRPDFVSKVALAKDKNWKSILMQKDAPLEERCYALLVNFNSVQKAVEEFYQKNDSKTDTIRELLQNWEEKSKTENKSSKKFQKKQRKVVSGSNAEPINSTAANEKDAQIYMEDKTKDSNATVLNKKNVLLKTPNICINDAVYSDDDCNLMNSEDKLKINTDQNNSRSSLSNAEVSISHDKQESNSIIAAHKTLITKSKNLKTVATFDLKELANQNKIPFESNPVDETSNIDVKIKKKDSFFLGGESDIEEVRDIGKGFVKKNYVEKSPNSFKFEPKMNFFKSRNTSYPSKNKFNKFQNIKQGGTYGQHNKFHKKEMNSTNKLEKKSSASDNIQIKNNHNYLDKGKDGKKQKNILNEDTSLHPSWVAKKKLKAASNVKFEGKRTVF